MGTAKQRPPCATPRRRGSLIRSGAGRSALRAAAILSVLCMHGCEQGCDMQETPTRISVEGEDVPVFRVSGSGSIFNFRVVRQKETPDTRGVLWLIEHSGGGVAEIRRLGPITYGVVPPEFRQKVPEDGAKPPPLQDGIRYGAGAYTVNGWPGKGCDFVMKDGRAVQE
jgi:hypothetical protein